jgi:hypothetical protein
MADDSDLFCPQHSPHGPSEDEHCDACDDRMIDFAKEVEQAIRRGREVVPEPSQASQLVKRSDESPARAWAQDFNSKVLRRTVH